MQYGYFVKLEYIPEKLNISIRSLLLTQINITPKILLKQHSLYNRDIGAYLLTRLSQINKENTNVKDLIKKAYIEKNKSIDEYIDSLEKECKLCLYELNYVQKEKMKKYLLDSIY